MSWRTDERAAFGRTSPPGRVWLSPRQVCPVCQRPGFEECPPAVRTRRRDGPRLLHFTEITTRTLEGVHARSRGTPGVFELKQAHTSSLFCAACELVGA